MLKLCQKKKSHLNNIIVNFKCIQNKNENYLIDFKYKIPNNNVNADEHYMSVNKIKFFEFLEFLTFRNFNFIFIKNKISLNFILSMVEFSFQVSSNVTYKNKNFNVIVINYFLFVYYKNPQILFNLFTVFMELYQYKIQRGLNMLIKKCIQSSSLKFLTSLGILGLQVKLKGKYTQRPGDRRKIYYYRKGEFSINSPHKKFILHHSQLVDKSGATGFTIIMMYA